MNWQTKAYLANGRTLHVLALHILAYLGKGCTFWGPVIEQERRRALPTRFPWPFRAPVKVQGFFTWRVMGLSMYGNKYLNWGYKYLQV